MKELVINNLKTDTIEQLKQDGKLVNRVFVSFELENTTNKSFKDVRIKLLYKMGGKDNSYEIAINHVSPNEVYTYGYEQYLTKEVLELSSEIEYKEAKGVEQKEFAVYKFNKGEELLFKIANKTGNDVNYARVYIEFIKGKKAFTGTNILLSAIKNNEEREIEFILPKSFKCDSYVLKVDYSDEKIMSVYQFGKKYVEVMQEYMEATNVDEVIQDIGGKANSLGEDIEYYDNYKPLSFGKALWQATKDSFSGLFDLIMEGIIAVLGALIPFIIIFVILLIADLPIFTILLYLLLALPVIMLIVIVVKTIKIMRSNLTKEEVQQKSDELQEKLVLLQKDLGDTSKRLDDAVDALSDLEFRNPQYELPPLETVSKLFLKSLTSAIEETDISWSEVMRVTQEKYYADYEKTQQEIAKLEGEMIEAVRVEEERNKEMQRQFEEQKFRERMLNEQRAANYARQSELERQTREMERANRDSWEMARRETDALNAIYRDRYYNN